MRLRRRQREFTFPRNHKHQMVPEFTYVLRASGGYGSLLGAPGLQVVPWTVVLRGCAAYGCGELDTVTLKGEFTRAQVRAAAGLPDLAPWQTCAKCSHVAYEPGLRCHSCGALPPDADPLEVTL